METAAALVLCMGAVLFLLFVVGVLAGVAAQALGVAMAHGGRAVLTAFSQLGWRRLATLSRA